MHSIFVSSTFTDMEAERDILREKVFPAVNTEAVRHGDSIRFCDLRWGIDTSEMTDANATVKVMTACVDLLNKSDDLAVIILGDRYGWIPDEKYFIEAASVNSRLSLLSSDQSITSLEINYALDHCGKHILVYFRELIPETAADVIPDLYFEQTPSSKTKLAELKRKLIDNPACEVKTYKIHYSNSKGLSDKDITGFGDILTEDIKSFYSDDWKEFDNKTDFEREMAFHRVFFQEKSAQFSHSDSYIDAIKQFMSPDLKESDLLVIEGLSGSGKSAIVSKAFVELEADGYHVLPISCGLTNHCGTAAEILQIIIYYLENLLNIPHKYEFCANIEQKEKEKLKNYLVLLTDKLSAGKNGRLAVILDSFERLYHDEDRDELIFLVNSGCSSIRYVLTVIPDTSILSNTYLLEVAPLNNREKNETIKKALASHNKELSQSVIDKIISKPGTEKPLYISMLVDMLSLMDSSDYKEINSAGGQIDAIVNHQVKMIDGFPKNCEDMAGVLLKKASDKTDPDFAAQVMNFIAVSRKGLRMSDLVYCLGEKWNTLSFYRLINFLPGQFQERSDGRIDFAYNAAKQNILAAISDRSSYHHKLEWCFHCCDAEDPIRASELLYHCIKRDDFRYACAVVNAIEKLPPEKLKLYIKSFAASAVEDRGAWVNKWLDYLKNKAAGLEASGIPDNSREHNSAWYAVWFLNEVLIILPDSSPGFETGHSVSGSIRDSLEAFKSGTVNSRFIERISSKIAQKYQFFSSKVGKEWQSLMSARDEYYKAKANCDVSVYEQWKNLYYLCYRWVFFAKNHTDRNVVISALEAVKCGIDLLSNREFVIKGLKESLYYGEFYGCIGDVCAKLGCYDRQLYAYQQDLIYREQKHLYNPDMINLYSLGCSYGNLQRAYLIFDQKGYAADKGSEKSSTSLLSLHGISLEPLRKKNIPGESLTEAEAFIIKAQKEKPYVSSWLAAEKRISVLEQFTADELKKISEAFGGVYVMSPDRAYKEYTESYFYFKEKFDFDDSDGDLKYADKILKDKEVLIKSFKGLDFSFDRCTHDPSSNNFINCTYFFDLISRNIRIRKYMCADYAERFCQIIEKAEKFVNHCYMCARNDKENHLPPPDYNQLISGSRFAEKGGPAQAFLMYCCFECAMSFVSAANDPTVMNMAADLCKTGLKYIADTNMLTVTRKRGAIIIEDNIVKKNAEIDSYIVQGKKKLDCIIRNVIMFNLYAANPDDEYCKDRYLDVKKELADYNSGVFNSGKAETYSGDIEDGIRRGYGEVSRPDGYVYKGYWCNGLHSGYGEESFFFGKKCYSGMWENGLKSGYGEATLLSGTYCGEWLGNRYHGYGIRTDSKGKTECGIWENGKLKTKMPKILVNSKLSGIKKAMQTKMP